MVFPLVSRSTFTEDRETTKRYIQVTMRYSLIFAAAIGVVMAAKPTDMLGVLYAHDMAAAGGSALFVLALGNVAFSVFAIAGTILNGAGMTRPAIVTAAITLALAAAANYIAIPMAMESGQFLGGRRGGDQRRDVARRAAHRLRAVSRTRRVPAGAERRARRGCGGDRDRRRPRAADARQADDARRGRARRHRIPRSHVLTREAVRAIWKPNHQGGAPQARLPEET